MLVREFHPDDTRAVVQLWHECELCVPWNDPLKDIQRKLKVMPELFLVGESDGDVVASVMGGYDGHRGWINYLAVSPAHRNKRYARALLDELESRLYAMGCPKINLQVRSSNSVVIEFYEHLGFTRDACVNMGRRLIPDD